MAWKSQTPRFIGLRPAGPLFTILVSGEDDTIDKTLLDVGTINLVPRLHHPPKEEPALGVEHLLCLGSVSAKQTSEHRRERSRLLVHCQLYSKPRSLLQESAF